MKPLRTDKRLNEEQTAVENFKNKMDQEKREKDQDEIRSRLEKAKEKRTDKERLAGKTLGAVHDAVDESLLSAADWVKRSRNKELSDKERAKIEAQRQAARLQEEEEERGGALSKYSTQHLKGLAVQHDSGAFEAGKEIILTLQDSNILEKDDLNRTLGLNESEDVLENVNIAENERRIDAEKRGKRARQSVYSGYDDEEFEGGSSVVGKKQGILSQYDEENWTGNVKRGPAIKLGENGVVDGDTEGAGAENSMDITRKAESLRVEARDVASFYTATEFASVNFKSKAKKDKKEKKKRKARKRDVEIEDDPLAHLTGEENSADHGIRTGTSSGFDKLAEDEAARREAYESASNKAAEKSSTKTKIMTMDDGDDAELAQALARARRVMQTEHKADKDRATEVALVVSATRDQTLQQNGGDDGEYDLENAVNADGRRPDGSLVFTTTTEFTTRLQSRLHDKARNAAEAALKEEER